MRSHLARLEKDWKAGSGVRWNWESSQGGVHMMKRSLDFTPVHSGVTRQKQVGWEDQIGAEAAMEK